MARVRSLVVALIALACVSLASRPVSAYTNPITIKNYKMYDSVNGEYFGVRGVDYYPRANTGARYDINNYDFFTDAHRDIWGPDIAHLAALGANAVRLYAVDSGESHDQFMCALRAHGMYALVDLAASCQGCAITKDKSPACYPSKLKKRGEEIITAFAKYDNVLAFSAGNEVNHVVDSPEVNAPCQKKFLRDMRKHIARCATLRDIPVGVVLADTDRSENAMYYNCRTNATDVHENAEWYGLNVYQYCNHDVKTAADSGGFAKMLSDFQGYQLNIPVLLTEFGCLNEKFPTVDGYEAQRTWLQAGWLHSEAFRTQFNGGFVFEYSTENANSKAESPYPFTTFGQQNFGLGYFEPATCNHDTVPCFYKRMPNFQNLAEQYNKTDYSDEPAMDAFVADSSKTAFPACPTGFPTLGSITWPADSLASIGCPTARLDYTCPGQLSSTPVSSSGSTSSTPTPTTTAPTTPSATTSTPSPSPSSATSARSTATWRLLVASAAAAASITMLLL